MTQMRDTERLLRERILDLQEQLEASQEEALAWKRRNFEKEDEITEQWMPLKEQLEALREVLETLHPGLTLDEILNVAAMAREKQREYAAARFEGFAKSHGEANPSESIPASGPSYDFAGSAPDGHATPTQSGASGEGNDPALGADSSPASELNTFYGSGKVWTAPVPNQDRKRQ
jgi:hypothetical protein